VKHVIPTGTDVATICFFDPAALPDDFDERVKDDTVETFRALAKEGRIWSQDTGSDGGFIFHFYLGGAVPAEIQAHCSDKQVVERFFVPGGCIWACGAEYAARQPDVGCGAGPSGGLKKFFHMGGKFEVPPGEYALSIWHGEWPEDACSKLVETKVAQAMGDDRYRHYKRRRKLADLVVFVTGLVTIYAVGFVVVNQRFDLFGSGTEWTWPTLVFGSWAGAIAAFLTRSNPEERRSAADAALDFPDVVIQMDKLPTSA
jgi:hypothetical protein